MSIHDTARLPLGRRETSSKRFPQGVVDHLAMPLAKAIQTVRTHIANKRTNRLFEQFSDYRLDDIGFERDWDGAIQPKVRSAGLSDRTRNAGSRQSEQRHG